MKQPNPPSFFVKALTRRTFTGSLLALPLVGCQDSETVAVRFRVIAKVLYKGQPYEASTVMECRYWRVKNSLTGMGGGTKLIGEALIFDLPEGAGTFYVLPYERNKNGGLTQVYEFALLRTFGIKNSVGGLSDADLESLKFAKGRHVLDFFGRLPVIVAFKDEVQPKTVFEISPKSIGSMFSDTRFIGVDLEITTEPVTERIRQRLPWLNTPSSTQVFDRDPPGHLKPASELPISFIMNTYRFFGDGSR